MLVHCEKASETFQNIAGWNVVKNTLKTIIFRYNSNKIQITFVATKMSNLLCHHLSASPKCMSWSVLYEWQAWGQIYSKMYINTLHRVSAYTNSACSNMYAWSVCTVCAYVNLGLHKTVSGNPCRHETLKGLMFLLTGQFYLLSGWELNEKMNTTLLSVFKIKRLQLVGKS